MLAVRARGNSLRKIVIDMILRFDVTTTRLKRKSDQQLGNFIHSFHFSEPSLPETLMEYVRIYEYLRV